MLYYIIPGVQLENIRSLFVYIVDTEICVLTAHTEYTYY